MGGCSFRRLLPTMSDEAEKGRKGELEFLIDGNLH